MQVLNENMNEEGQHVEAVSVSSRTTGDKPISPAKAATVTGKITTSTPLTDPSFLRVRHVQRHY